ncbi:ABC transporter ATP-binding protein [Euzebya sp.]|uniref:ABC transporter ATP-binding protein n=1 Tax=Euzebya sp. TaxID=1971409 RepID=UPI0035194A0A
MTEQPGAPKRKLVLRVQGLTRAYEGVTALADFDLDVARGEGVVLFGHNGSGKTTALDCIAGLLTPTGGRIRVAGADPHTEPEAAKARAATAYVDDAPIFYRDLTVAEHVELVAVAHGADLDDVDPLLDELGLAEHHDHLPHQLSAGLQQRTQLACALIRPFRLILLDEPTLRLDPAGRDVLHRRLHAVKRRGRALVFSTHRPDFASGLADRALVLSRGDVVADGPLDAVVASPEAAAIGITPT